MESYFSPHYAHVFLCTLEHMKRIYNSYFNILSANSGISVATCVYYVVEFGDFVIFF